MKTSTKILMCLAGIALVVLGVLCIIYPGSTLVSLAWAFGLMLIISGCSTFGAWATLRAINPFNAGSAGCGSAFHLCFLGVL